MGFIIHTKTLSTNPGSKTVASRVAFGSRTIKQVLREGINYDIVRGVAITPTNRQVWVGIGGSVFTFASEFNPGETVIIKWI